MEKYHFGEIVLIKFPYTDGDAFKRRPALVINDFMDGDIIVCRITSQLYNTKNDIALTEWKQSGLKLPSVIRVHKLATLNKELIEKAIGQIDSLLKEQVRNILSNLTTPIE
jgi:mRNA interferase MazF